MPGNSNNGGKIGIAFAALPVGYAAARVLQGLPRHGVHARHRPRILRVPVLLGFAYVGMGYLSWTLGTLILGDVRGPLAGSQVIAVPLTASFIMAAWDLATDPIWSTVMHGWIWPKGGAYFGVPVSNSWAGISRLRDIPVVRALSAGATKL